MFCAHFCEEIMTESKRMNQVNSEIQKFVMSIISRLDDSAIANSMISIMKVDTFADFSLSKIYVSVFGNEEKKNAVVAKLNDNKKTIRYELAHKVRFKKVPDLLFVVDDFEEKSERVLKLFEKIESETDFIRIDEF